MFANYFVILPTIGQQLRALCLAVFFLPETNITSCMYIQYIYLLVIACLLHAFSPPPDESEEECFDEDSYYERLGTRPALDINALGAAYRRMVELFCLCTEQDPTHRPSANQIVQALEINAPSEVIVLD